MPRTGFTFVENAIFSEVVAEELRLIEKVFLILLISMSCFFTLSPKKQQRYSMEWLIILYVGVNKRLKRYWE